MGLCRTVYEINGDFGQKLQILPTTVDVTPHRGSFPWDFVTR